MGNKLTVALLEGPVEPRPKSTMKVSLTILSAKHVWRLAVFAIIIVIGYGACGSEGGCKPS